MTSLRRRINILESRIDAIKNPKTTYTFVWKGPASDCPIQVPSLTPENVSELLRGATRAGYLSPDLESWQPDKRAYSQAEYLEILEERRRMTLGPSDDQQPDLEGSPDDGDSRAEYGWADLTEDEKALWTVLGWDEATWGGDESEYLPYQELDWDELSDEQQDALCQLGYDRASWDTSGPRDEDVK